MKRLRAWGRKVRDSFANKGDSGHRGPEGRTSPSNDELARVAGRRESDVLDISPEAARDLNRGDAMGKLTQKKPEETESYISKLDPKERENRERRRKGIVPDDAGALYKKALDDAVRKRQADDQLAKAETDNKLPSTKDFEEEARRAFKPELRPGTFELTINKEAGGEPEVKGTVDEARERYAKGW